jgi:hypothetical protein
MPARKARRRPLRPARRQAPQSQSKSKSMSKSKSQVEVEVEVEVGWWMAGGGRVAVALG